MTKGCLATAARTATCFDYLGRLTSSKGGSRQADAEPLFDCQKLQSNSRYMMLLTAAAKFIQSSHQKGILAMSRESMRIETTTSMRHSTAMSRTNHDMSVAGSMPHSVFVTFVAAASRDLWVSTMKTTTRSKMWWDSHRTSTIVQLLCIQTVAWLLMTSLAHMHARSVDAHDVELAIAVDRHDA